MEAAEYLKMILISFARYLGIILVSYFLSAFIFRYLLRMMQDAGMVKLNYKNENIPAMAGLIFVVILPITVGLGILFSVKSFTLIHSVLYLFVVIGMGFLGMLDDLIGNHEHKGFKGHFKVLFKENRLTAGAFKALFGAVIAFVFSGASTYLLQGGWNFWTFISSFLLVVLSANTINLFDLRPGRAAKVFLLGFVIIFAFSKQFEQYIGLFISILAILLFYLPFDLKAKAMMGDVGSNLLGATLGVMMSWMLSGFGKVLAIIILLAIQIAAERYSFSKIIEENRWLQYLDNLGRRKS